MYIAEKNRTLRQAQRKRSAADASYLGLDGLQ